MRRYPSSIVAVVVLALGVAGTSCGVLADTTAASVGGHDITIESVQDLASDESFVGDTTGVTDSSVPGDLFRSLLAYEIQRVAWVVEAERWGLEITDAELAAAREQVLPQIEAGGVSYESSTVDAIVESVAAQTLLEQHFAQIDPEDDTVLRQFYDGLPEGYWDRLCIAVTQLDVSQIDEVGAALDDGAAVEEIPEQVEGTQLVAEAVEPCLSVERLNEQLLEAFLGAETGATTGPLTIEDGAGGEVAFVFRLDSRKQLDFDAARDELVQVAQALAQQGPTEWISLLMSAAEIDPRFGTEVQVGSTGQATILAPPVPLVITPDLTELLGAEADTGA